MKTYKIHLIRNGLTQGNLDGRYIGHTDEGLSSAGGAQLLQLKEEYIYPEVQAVFTSPLARCTQTAAVIYPQLTPIAIRELIEYDFGEFEGKTADELENSEEFKAWISGSADSSPPFGESNADFQKRVTQGFVKIVEGLFKAKVESAAIVTHGGVIMTIMTAFGVPELPMHEWLTPNGCGYTLNILPSVWCKAQKAEVFGEAPQAPANQNEDKSSAGGYDEFSDDGDSFFDGSVSGSDF